MPSRYNLFAHARNALAVWKAARAFGIHDAITLLSHPKPLVCFYTSYYLHCYGALQSFTSQRPETADRQPLPWYTYPCIRFLDQIDFSACRVLEFGSGNSSRYWAQRASSVTSVEADSAWHQTVQEMQIPNHDLRLAETFGQYTLQGVSLGDFDVYIVDGAYRFDCAKRVIESASPGALAIVDNSDWFPNTCRLFIEAGYTRVDFSGPGPINAYPWCTSLFFHSQLTLRYRDDRPVVTGGLENWIENPDDAPHQDSPAVESPPA